MNKNIANNIYSEKCRVYSTSNFIDTVSIANDYSEWSKDKINIRQSKMGKVAKGIWKIDF